MAESSKLASKKADKKSKGKATEGSAVVPVDAPSEPSPSKRLKRKKSAVDVVDAGTDDAPVKSRKKAKKDGQEGEAPAPVEGKKKKAGKAADDSALAPAEPMLVDEDAAPKTKSKKAKSKAPDASVPDAVPAESSTTPAEKPAKKPKKAKVAAPPSPPAAEPKPLPVEDAPKPAKKAKKSKAEEPAPELAPEPSSIVEDAPKPSKKSKKSKTNAPDTSVPDAAPAESSTMPAEKPAKKAKKSKVAAPSPSPEPAPIEDVEAAEDSEEEEAPLHGFSTDDDDSSDEDDDGHMDVEVSAFDVAKLPTIAKDDATVKRKLENAKRQPTGDRGVLFLGRIPHGFYEDQLKAYFTQFGTVTRLRVSRNKKTGQSKHYGFLEFDSSSVAQIVAETMDNYLLMGHILRCKVIPKAEVHPELWIGANRRWRPVPKARVAQAEYNKPRTEDAQLRAAHRLLKRQQERQRKLEKAGITYDLGAVGYQPRTALESSA